MKSSEARRRERAAKKAGRQRGARQPTKVRAVPLARGALPALSAERRAAVNAWLRCWVERNGPERVREISPSVERKIVSAYKRALSDFERYALSWVLAHLAMEEETSTGVDALVDERFRIDAWHVSILLPKLDEALRLIGAPGKLPPDIADARNEISAARLHVETYGALAEGRPEIVSDPAPKYVALLVDLFGLKERAALAIVTQALGKTASALRHRRKKA